MYFVALPIPIISPTPNIILKIGRAKFNAARPLAPNPFATKKVSAKI